MLPWTHSDYLRWEMNIYFSYLFCLLLHNIYFRSLDAEKNKTSFLQSAFCCCVSVKLADIVRSCKQDKIGGLSWFNDFIGRLNHVHKRRPTLSIVWYPHNSDYMTTTHTQQQHGISALLHRYKHSLPLTHYLTETQQLNQLSIQQHRQQQTHKHGSVESADLSWSADLFSKPLIRQY